MMNNNNPTQSRQVNPIVNVAKASLVALVVSLVVVSNGIADWSGGIEGGTVVNNDGQNATRLRLKVSNETRPLSHYVYADWLRAGTDDSFEAGYKPRYWFGESLYVFGEASALRNKPRSIDRELLGSTGVGVVFLKSETRSLYAEVGAGYRTTEFDDGREDDNDTAGLARAGFQQNLGDLLSFELEANTNVSDKQSSSVAEAGIAVRVPGGALKFSVRAQRYKFGDLEAVTTSDSFVSFNYGF